MPFSLHKNDELWKQAVDFLKKIWQMAHSVKFLGNQPSNVLHYCRFINVQAHLFLQVGNVWRLWSFNFASVTHDILFLYTSVIFHDFHFHKLKDSLNENLEKEQIYSTCCTYI